MHLGSNPSRQLWDAAVERGAPVGFFFLAVHFVSLSVHLPIIQLSIKLENSGKMSSRDLFKSRKGTYVPEDSTVSHLFLFYSC